MKLTSKTKKNHQTQLKGVAKLNKKRNLYLKVPSNVHTKTVGYHQIYPIHLPKKM